MRYLPNQKGISARTEKVTPAKRPIVLITEGTKTEKVYFNWLRTKFRLSSVNIRTIGVGGDPLTVSNVAIEEYSNDKTCDMVYCIVDRDKHPRNKFIEAKDKLISPKNKKKFRLILSYPCIEYWFLLHIVNDMNPYEQPVDGDGSMGRVCKRKLKKYYSKYDEGNAKILTQFFDSKFTEATRLEAIKRARDLQDSVLKNDTINPLTMLFIPAMDIESMANPELGNTSSKIGNPIIEILSQEEYEQYIEEVFDIFNRQKKL
jgi:hypothetical protein